MLVCPFGRRCAVSPQLPLFEMVPCSHDCPPPPSGSSTPSSLSLSLSPASTPSPFIFLCLQLAVRAAPSQVLVLGAGFSGLSNLGMLPETVKTLVISCPGHPSESHLSLPTWPEGRQVEWLSLSAHTLQMDLAATSGCVRQLNIHTAFFFAESSAVGAARRLPRPQREAVADAALSAVLQGLVDDAELAELQLSVEVRCQATVPACARLRACVAATWELSVECGRLEVWKGGNGLLEGRNGCWGDGTGFGVSRDRERENG
eukprot:136694-Chlamydomonas_euryale.AAC.1